MKAKHRSRGRIELRRITGEAAHAGERDETRQVPRLRESARGGR
jgi:hypothetical protein